LASWKIGPMVSDLNKKNKRKRLTIFSQLLKPVLVDFEKIMGVYAKDDYLRKMYTELNEPSGEWLMAGCKALFQLAFQVFLTSLNFFINESGEYFVTQLAEFV
jgi:hypothetical protein